MSQPTIIDQLVEDCRARVEQIRAEEAKWQGVEGVTAAQERMYHMGRRHEAGRALLEALSAQLKERIYGYAGVA